VIIDISCFDRAKVRTHLIRLKL